MCIITVLDASLPRVCMHAFASNLQGAAYFVDTNVGIYDELVRVHTLPAWRPAHINTLQHAKLKAHT